MFTLAYLYFAILPSTARKRVLRAGITVTFDCATLQNIQYLLKNKNIRAQMKSPHQTVNKKAEPTVVFLVVTDRVGSWGSMLITSVYKLWKDL